MHILSFDVGIKHLAYCLIGFQDNSFIIQDWKVIDLCKNQQYKCQYLNCKRNATYYKVNCYYCKTHAKKHESYTMPTTKTTSKYLRSCKIHELRDILSETDISSNPISKKEIIEALQQLYETTVFNTIQETKASTLSLITIGKNMKEELDNIAFPTDIDYVIIENQISPIANRMKTLQGMITQYFIMRNYNNIEYISSANKLKFLSEFDTQTHKKLTYNERKKQGICITDKILSTNIHLEKWLTIFRKHKKNDDLADALLQGLWFAQHKQLFSASHLKL